MENELAPPIKKEKLHLEPQKFLRVCKRKKNTVYFSLMH